MPRKKKTEKEAEKTKEKKAVKKIASAGKTITEEGGAKEIGGGAVKKILKKELIEKAKKIEEKIKQKEEKDIKKEIEESEKEKRGRAKRAEKTLFPLDDYVKYSCHLGTKAVTPNMRKFVYKRRADGIAVLNTNDTDEKLKQAAEFLKDFKQEDIFIACKREAGWEAAKKFSEVTGIQSFLKKYPAGIITNPNLEDFFEIELVIICDPWIDKNALNDAIKLKKPVIALCDTNNLTRGVTKIVPCNNKSGKSIGIILYLLAREYLKNQGKEKEAKALKIEDFTGVVETTEKRKKGIKERGGAKEGV